MTQASIFLVLIVVRYLLSRGKLWYFFLVYLNFFFFFVNERCESLKYWHSKNRSLEWVICLNELRSLHVLRETKLNPNYFSPVSDYFIHYTYFSPRKFGGNWVLFGVLDYRTFGYSLVSSIFHYQVPKILYWNPTTAS